jgi:predicted DNA-binding transcriptional regulator AlpA
MPKTEERLILRPKDIREILGLGRVQVYELWKRKDFPGKRHGRSLFVARDAFFRWLEQRDEE